MIETKDPFGASKSSLDKNFISAILKEQSLKVCLEKGFKVGWLEHPFNTIYSYIFDHFIEHGKVASIETIELKFGDIYVEPNENVSYYLNNLKNREKLNRAQKLARDILSTIKEAKTIKQKEEALVNLQKIITETSSYFSLYLSGVKIQDIFEEIDKEIVDYSDRKDEEKIKKRFIKTPWEILNDEILGWDFAEFVTFLGSSGTGKTWCLLLCLIMAALDGKKVLLFTEEMTIASLGTRVYAMLGQFNFKELKKSKFDDLTETIYFESLKDLREKRKNNEIGSFRIVQGSGQQGTDAVIAIIKEEQPDIVGIDGAYLLSEDYTWEKVSKMVGKLRAACLAMQIPFLLTNQVASKAATTKSAFSSAFINYATIAIQLIKDPDKRDLPFMNFKPLKIRDGSFSSDTIWCSDWDLENMKFAYRPDILPDDVVFDEE